MNKTTLPIFKIQLLMAGLFLSQTTFYGQNLNINYTPLESICSFDTLGCTGVVSFPFSLSANETEGLAVTHQLSENGAMPAEDVYGSLSGVYPGYFISGNYPIGQYTFEVTAIRGLDTLVADVSFSVVDCVAPTMEVANGKTYTLEFQLDGSCKIVGSVYDFITAENFDCSEPLNYSILRDSDFQNGLNPLDISLDTIIFTGQDEEIFIVWLFVWDDAFNPYIIQPDSTLGGANYQYYWSYVLLQAPPFSEGCGGGHFYVDIQGTTKTETNEGVEGVEVQASGSEFLDALTDENGFFEFQTNLSSIITITPHLNAFCENGVTTHDLIIISKHIMGVQLINSPYKLIAADVNSSGTISAADVIHLRKLILRIYTSFPNNTSWRFVDADYVFADPSNPWAEDFPEVIKIINPNYQTYYTNFIAIKIGDVNGSALPN